MATISPRRLTLGVPVILISGNAERIERLQGGPLPFIAKPFRGVVLVELVKSLLARG
jgi:FixJ family two-component response regulator